MKKNLLIATTNKNKIKEFQKMLSNDYNIKSLLDYPEIPEVPENELTFEGNAIIKAQTISKLLNIPVISDDSGICVNALNGKPGVRSARWASDHNDSANCQKLINKMKDKHNRNAYYVTVIALAQPNKPVQTFRGELHGTISKTKSNRDGFAYDTLFIPNGYNTTINEINNKNDFSQRRIAIDKCLQYMKTLDIQ